MADNMNFDDAIENAVMQVLENNGDFAALGVKTMHFHDATDDKVLPVVIVHAHDIGSFENSTIALEGTIRVIIRTKEPEDKDHSEADSIFQVVLGIMRTSDSSVFDAYLAPDSDFAFNGFAKVTQDESFDDAKKEQDKEVICDARFWIQ